MAKSGTYRTTISVPADLKKRMDKVKEDVNWSALACRAFEGKLAEIVAKKEKKSMDDVIQRLRASKTEFESELYKEGLAAGEQWAKDTADAAELTRLEGLRSSLNEREWAWYFEADDANASNAPASERVASATQPDMMIDEFWDCAVGEDEAARDQITHAEFVHGFADGALGVWREVRSQL